MNFKCGFLSGRKRFCETTADVKAGREPRLKGTVILTGILLATALLFPGQQRMKPPRSTISTGSVGGSWYSICTTIADEFNARVAGYPLTAIPGSGGFGNPIRIARRESDIGVTFTPFLLMAREGQAPYEEKYSNLRVICSLSSNYHHFLVEKGVAAGTLLDVARKKIGIKLCTGFPGEANYILLNLIFGELGMEESDIKLWGGSLQRIGTTGKVDLWKDRHINAMHSLIQYPASSVTEAMATREGKLLGLSESVRDALARKYGFIEDEIPPRTYPGQHDPVPTVRLAMVLFAHSEVSEEFVYILTRAVAESEERLRRAYGSFKNWSAEDMIRNLDFEIHPGALRYYKEQGWM